MRTTWTGRRQAERRTVSIKAQARFYDGSPAVECEITDYSATGARVVFGGDFEPPGAFDLFVPSRGETFHAQLRWKTADAIGVEFIQAKGSTEDQRLSELLVRVSRIEDELRAVKAGSVLAQASGVEMPVPPVPPAPSAMPEPVPSVDPAEHAALMQRVERLERRSDELIHALKETLGMLRDLRDASAPGVRAA